MKVTALIAAPLALLTLIGCSQSRKGGELRLKHEVTIETAAGPRTFHSVVSLDGFQSYNYHPGSSGWGGISCRLTGDALRVPLGDHDFYFLLARPRHYTPAWTQIGLIKTHFGLPNFTADRSWIDQWKDLAASDAAVDLLPEDFPAIAVMPRDGWMNDARPLSLEDAEALGLRIIRYRLQLTRDPVGSQESVQVRYRSSKERNPRIEIGREFFTEVNGTA